MDRCGDNAPLHDYIYAAAAQKMVPKGRLELPPEYSD